MENLRDNEGGSEGGPCGVETKDGRLEKAFLIKQEFQEAAWTAALQNHSVTHGTPVIVMKGLQLDKLLQVHESCTTKVHAPSHPALHPDLVEPVNTN